MKIKQTALLLGLATFGLVSFAQDNKPESAPANPPPANTEPAKADPPAPTPANADQAPNVPDTLVVQAAPAPQAAGQPAVLNPSEVVPLIVIDDVPLNDAIRNLARQSNLNFQFDPRITAAGGDGK